MKTAHDLGKQRGVMLLEALIAILIFSIGILAIIGMQAISVQNVAQAKYRTDASFLANDIIGQVWANRGAGMTASTFKALGAWTDWQARVVAALPGVSVASNTMPTISFAGADTTANANGGGSYTAYTVKIAIKWQAPNENSAHRYDAIAYVPFCPTNNC